ncbi:transposase [Lactococcus lactis]
MKTNKYYIHLLIKCKLQNYISNMIKSLKSLSARRMFIAYT